MDWRLQGDGGGPLVCEDDGYYELTGLVSWGFGCGRRDVPGVYVKISSFIGWINQIISVNNLWEWSQTLYTKDKFVIIAILENHTSLSHRHISKVMPPILISKHNLSLLPLKNRMNRLSFVVMFENIRKSKSVSKVYLMPKFSPATSRMIGSDICY